MDTGVIGLLLAGTVGAIQLLTYISTRTLRKEVSEEKFAKADGVTNELTFIRSDIGDLEEKLDDHGSKISGLQMASAVLISQMQAQISALEKLNDKLDELK